MPRGKKNTVSQTTTKRPIRITLQYLIKEELPIWVVNKTGVNVGKDAGVVTFQVGMGANTGSVTIPPGSDPVCITDQVDPESLRSCRDLFKLIRSRTLELLDPENADKYYEDNEDRREAMKEKLDSYLNQKREKETPKSIDERDAAVQVNPKVGDVCQKARYEAITAKQALERLMEQSAVLGEADYQYLLNNGHYDAVKSWAKEKLEEARQ